MSSVAAALQSQNSWLVTGGAGFIGSHIVSELLRHNQLVTVLDNFSTGLERNLEYIAQSAPQSVDNLRVVRASVEDAEAVKECLRGVHYVLHQAALGSIPRSFSDPLPTDSSNVHGFLTVFHAALKAEVRSVVFASSSSVYGSSPRLPKIESEIGSPLSPYAVSKLSNELYASVFSPRHENVSVAALRYFNVFGPRQNPSGAYAAVIPRWIGEMLSGKQTLVYGDGSQSRDFCFVANVVQANILAAVATSPRLGFRTFNVAAGARTSLLDLHSQIRDLVSEFQSGLRVPPPQFSDRRAGDIPHSHADITRAEQELGYRPSHSVLEGLRETVRWYVAHPEAL